MIRKAVYPLLKDPKTGAIYPNSAPFTNYEGLVGCFNTEGVTDPDKLSAEERQTLWPTGVPESVTEAARKQKEAEDAKLSELPIAGVKMEATVVKTNLERLFAEGAITRKYLLELAGGVTNEDFLELERQAQAAIDELTKIKSSEEHLEAEAKKAEAEAKKAKEEAKKAEAKAEEAKKAKEKKAPAKKTATKKATAKKADEKVEDDLEDFKV